MRTKFVAAIVLVAGVISFSSCNWFKSASKENDFNIQGKWKIDSLNGNDSFAASLLAITTVNKDSIPAGIDFKEDSTYVKLPVSINAKGRYYVKEKELFVANDTSYVRYNLNVVSDSLIHVSGKDSLFIAMKRQ